MTDLATPRLVSNFLLSESRERGEVLTNLKLQKLLFYAQAWFLTLHNSELFGEDFEAWVHGPVLPSEYRRFRDYQWRPLLVDVDRPSFDSGDIEEHLIEVIDVFGSETAVSLELMTHRELPWLEARGDLPSDAPSTAAISKEDMRDFYRSLTV